MRTADSEDETNNAFGDDFDDFEEGDQTAADDDFGDFDDFNAAEDDEPSPPTPPATTTFPLIDFDALSSLPDLLESTKMHLDAMFPTTVLETGSTTASDDIPADSPIFPSERSRSLWKQLITPPPLQPPNWTQSRIRRLFLISLGVPVDLDEILPPSKQKKLILPDIDLRTPSVADDETRPANDSIAKLKDSKANDSTTSVNSTQSAPTGNTKRGRERPKSLKPGQIPPPPALDLNAVQRICSTTDEKLTGLTDEELLSHIKELEALTETTMQVLEYHLKLRDSLKVEKEAFEGVIENLVRHAKRFRGTVK